MLFWILLKILSRPLAARSVIDTGIEVADLPMFAGSNRQELLQSRKGISHGLWGKAGCYLLTCRGSLVFIFTPSEKGSVW